MNQQGTNESANRPEVLETVSTTQLDELERHYADGDRQNWNTLSQSYGWSTAQADAVWSWFGQRPVEGQTRS